MEENQPGERLDSVLERDAEQQRLHEALDSASEGNGRLVVVEGAAGVGKSTLLAHACGRARQDGFLVLQASGDELERTFSFGVTIQLFAEPAGNEALQGLGSLSGAAELAMPLLDGRAQAPSANPTPAFPLLHGLHWIVAGLAERSPLLLAVDDAHWADPPSLRFLAYLAQRLEALPVAVAVTTRFGEEYGSEVEAMLARLRAHPLASTMTLAPLGEDSARQLVARELPDADGTLGSAFFAATEGNPFLLRELLDAARRQGEVTASGVRALRPEGIRASILVRLGRLGEDAHRLALAVAVLGPAATTKLAARLAGLEDGAATAAADALRAAHILATGEPLGFIHAIVRETVYADLPVGRRHQDHLRAAALLQDAGAPAEEIASQLVPAGSAGEDWAVAALREAAGSAIVRGDPATATSLLRRALSEPGHDRDPGLVLELGRAEVASADPAALGHLEAARDLAQGPQEKAAALAGLGQALYVMGDSSGAFGAIRAALDLVPPGTGGLPEAELLCYTLPSGRLVPDLVDDVKALLEQPRHGVDGDMGPAEISRRAVLAFDLLLRGDREAASGNLEEVEARFGEESATRELPAFAGSALGLCLCFLGRYRDAQVVIDRQVEAARERGNLLDLAVSLEGRIGLGWLRGEVNACSADIEMLLGLNEEGWEVATVATRALAADVALERADRDAAEDVLAPAAQIEERLPGTLGWLWLPYARARVAMAAGAWESAREQALTAGERLLAIQAPSPDYLAWRSLAALAAVRLGEEGEALSLAEEELQLARSIGSPRAKGVALRALGVIRGADGGIELLSESVEELGRSEAELELVRARVELGVALRQARRAREARQPLEEALDAARRLGAVHLAERALGELRAAGGRPRRLALSGVESLTPAQARVAEMAASGMSNREIAETLFVTRRTVETHLTQVYAKLGLGSREELPEALASRGA